MTVKFHVVVEQLDELKYIC